MLPTLLLALGLIVGVRVLMPSKQGIDIKKTRSGFSISKDPPSCWSVSPTICMPVLFRELLGVMLELNGCHRPKYIVFVGRAEGYQQSSLFTFLFTAEICQIHGKMLPELN